MPDNAQHLLILTGDHSADIHAAAVARAMREVAPSWRISGVGAAAMREAGVTIIEDHQHMNVMGPAGIVRAIPSHRRLARKILEWVDEHRPDVVMLVDYGMFHLWLGPRLRKRGVRVIYFIPPQIWGSRPWRIRKLRRAADEILCILPFEEAYYRSRGMPATFVGNPLLSNLPPAVSREEFARRHGLDAGKTWIGLFPGSRRMEINHLLTPQVGAAARLSKQFPDRFEFVLARAVNLKDDLFNESMATATTAAGPEMPPLKIVRGENHALLSVADLAVLASGTVTLEAALYNTPMIIMYRGPKWVYYLARAMMTVKHIGMPNLLAGQRIVPELWQDEVTPQGIGDAVLATLNPVRRQQMKADLSRIASSFGDPNAARRVAEAVVKAAWTKKE